MIVDTLSNIKTYINTSSNLKIAIDYIINNNFNKLAPGRYELANGLFYLIQEYDTKPEADVKFESHLKYIDIQMILEGDEIIDIAPSKELIKDQGYDASKDIEFYSPIKKYIRLNLRVNEFGIFFPQDGHRPGIKLNSKKVKKLVFKIPV
jgi:biofilm protein TabA